MLHVLGVVHGVRVAMLMKVIDGVVGVRGQGSTRASGDSLSRFFVVLSLVNRRRVVIHESVLMHLSTLQSV